VPEYVYVEINEPLFFIGPLCLFEEKRSPEQVRSIVVDYQYPPGLARSISPVAITSKIQCSFSKDIQWPQAVSAASRETPAPNRRDSSITEASGRMHLAGYWGGRSPSKKSMGSLIPKSDG
jgi:hypothetical protein